MTVIAVVVVSGMARNAPGDAEYDEEAVAAIEIRRAAN